MLSTAVVCRVRDEGSIGRVQDEESVCRVGAQGTVRPMVRKEGSVGFTLVGRVWDQGTVSVVGGVRKPGSFGVTARQDLRISRRIETGRGAGVEQAPTLGRATSVDWKALRNRQYPRQQDGHPEGAHRVSTTLLDNTKRSVCYYTECGIRSFPWFGDFFLFSWQ